MKATYTKLRDQSWGVRVVGGPRPEVGTFIEVEKKSGEKKPETIDKVLWAGKDGGETVYLCAIRQSSAPAEADRVRVRELRGRGEPGGLLHLPTRPGVIPDPFRPQPPREQVMTADAKIQNALMIQRDRLTRDVQGATCPESLLAVLDDLTLVAPVWEAAGYEYKLKELRAALAARAKHLRDVLCARSQLSRPAGADLDKYLRAMGELDALVSVK